MRPIFEVKCLKNGPMGFFQKPLFFGCIAALALLMRINFPNQPVFDEIHYVNASQEITFNRTLKNEEHPPFLKLLIGLGLKTSKMIQSSGAVDRTTLPPPPLSFRLPSVLGGFFILMAVGLFLHYLSIPAIPSLWMILVSGQFLFHSRIAMLDSLALGLSLVSLLLYFYGLRLLRPFQKPEKTTLPLGTKALIGSGITLGLALATKWNTLLFGPFYLLGVTYLAIRCDQNRVTLLLKAIVVPISLAIASYAVTYAWLFCLIAPPPQAQSFASFLVYEFKEAIRLQKLVTTPHPNQEAWYQWPLLKTRYWMFFENSSAQTHQRAHLFVSNLPLLWMGFLAVCVNLLYRVSKIMRSINQKKPLESPNLTDFLSLGAVYFWVIWSVIPRKITYGYYFYPSVILISIYVGLRAFPQEKTRLSPFFRGIFLLSILWFLFYIPFIYGWAIPSGWYRAWLILPQWR